MLSLSFHRPISFYYKRYLHRYFRALKSPFLSIRSIYISRTMGLSDRQHFFIVGVPRSGTSLVSAVLKQHPAFSSAGAESHFMAIRNFCFINVPGMNSGTLNHFIASTHSRAEFFDHIADFYLNAKPGSDRFFDKTPAHALWAAELIKMFPNCQICFMIRDPLDAYVSLKASKVRDDTLDEFGIFWVEICKSIDKVPLEKRIVVKYEDLCSNFECELRRLAHFLGICPEELSKSAVFRKMEPGNFDESTGHSRIPNKVDSSSVGRWRSALSPVEQERLLHIVRDTAHAFGYHRDFVS